MSEKKCDFDCEGPDCNCQNFSMRKADQNKATTFYIACVLLLISASIFVVLASLINNKILDIMLIFVVIVDFALFFLMISNLPDDYDMTCTEYKVFYRDIGIPRLKRKYVFVIDVLIAAVPIMLFVWDIAHTGVAIQSGVDINDEVYFMYLFYLWAWTLRAQGILDAFLITVGLTLFFIEVIIWFKRRGGDLCTAYLDDIPIMGIDEIERRFQTLEVDYWEDITKNREKKWEDWKNQFKPKKKDDGI